MYVETDCCVCVCVFKVLNAIPDQDTFYDVSDALEEQGLEKVIGRYRCCKGVERDLLDQFHLYEAMLRHEDGVTDSTAELLSGRMDNLRYSSVVTAHVTSAKHSSVLLYLEMRGKV